MITYKISFDTTRKSYVKACYAFLTMDWGYLREVTIMGKDGPLNEDGGKTFRDTDPVTVSFQEFWQYYRKRRCGIMCMASADQNDRKRVGMMFLPEEILDDLDEDKDVFMAVSDYSGIGKQEMAHFFTCLKKRYNEIK